MSAGHTPGPWTAIDRSHVYTEGLQLVAVAQHGRSVEANARLIAAAPELLEALQAIVERVNGGSSYRMGADVDGLARAAIAKATGSAS